ncbi:MAG: menaquinone biosynthetic enzyme MqnA/MqnD family protein [Acidobacteriota bacterium]
MGLLIGQIPFLNCQPFYPLLSSERLVAMPPRELGRLAERGEIDAGIMATADYLRVEDDYEPVAGLGVANREEVRSILLYSRKPLGELAGARVGITEETSSSLRLLRLLLEVREGVRPREYVRGVGQGADAFLLIGNQALRSRSSRPLGFPYRFDLASEWWSWKRLPFVFALWAVKQTIPQQEKRRFSDLLRRSLAKGMAQVEEIAQRHAGELGSPAELASYLRNFRYRLGPEEMRGLDEFRRLVRERGLAEPM